ncbi:hypothetical protein EJ110_NYTH36655 [Nymphaea thermarum]|nr:hypothetical protein EJ110_NYTH36655 [Nymphaea thermarum]
MWPRVGQICRRDCESEHRAGGMGGKGKRRREKNYRAAHGGDSRLPPPPTASQIDALPSKLRKIMQLRSAHENREGGFRKRDDPKRDVVKKNELDAKGAKKKLNGNDMNKSLVVDSEDRPVRVALSPTAPGREVDVKRKGGHDDNKAKRKKREAVDLRFSNEAQDLASGSVSKRARRKMFLEERKKKHKRCKSEHTPEFREREEIKFGEVVEAPPKLTLPKVSKAHPSASRERLRLQAIEAFRKQRKWESRPGTHLPPMSAVVPSGVLD